MPEVKTELTQVIDYGIVADDLRKKVAADLAITINGVEDRAGYALADTKRKEWVKVRTSIDKRRKDMNALAREHIKRVDGVAAELTSIAGEAEDHVTKLVDAIDAEVARVKKAAEDKVFNERNAQLQHVGLNLNRLIIESLSDAEMAEMIAEKVESDRLRKAESERLAAEKLESDRIAALEREQHRIAAEKLAAERAAFEQEQAKANAESARQAANAAEKLAAQQARLDAEREAIESEKRKIAEIQRRNDEARRVEAETAARDKVLAEEAERVKAQAAIAAVRAEALRPDREKLLSVASAIHAIVIPQVCDELADTVKTINGIVIRAVSEITEAVHSI